MDSPCYSELFPGDLLFVECQLSIRFNDVITSLSKGDVVSVISNTKKMYDSGETRQLMFLTKTSIIRSEFYANFCYLEKFRRI